MKGQKTMRFHFHFSTLSIFKNCRFIILFAVLSFTKGFSQQTATNFSLSGNISGKKSGNIYLISYNDSGKRLVDSSKIVNHQFFFKGFVNGYSERVFLKLNPKEMENADSFNAVKMPIDNSNMKLKIDLNHFSKYQLLGCKTCDELKKFKIKNEKLYSKWDDWEKTLNQTEDDEKSDGEIEDTALKIANAKIDYIKKNKISHLSSFFLYDLFNDRFWWDEKNATTYVSLYQMLSNVEKNTFYGLKIKDNLAEINGILESVNSQMFDFSALDYKERKINFKEINAKNKYVLIECWASWCLPCRKQIPQLKELYSKYHNFGFEIISATVDESKEAWKKAIKKDQSDLWYQVFEIMEIERLPIKENNEFFKKLFVQTYPTLILIDQSGKIIGRYSEINELELKLKELF